MRALGPTLASARPHQHAGPVPLGLTAAGANVCAPATQRQHSELSIPGPACSALRPSGGTAMLRQKAEAPTAWARGHSSRVTTELVESGTGTEIRVPAAEGRLSGPCLPALPPKASSTPQSCQQLVPLRERPLVEGKVPHPFQGLCCTRPPTS